jgi:hypothetical protein
MVTFYSEFKNHSLWAKPLERLPVLDGEVFVIVMVGVLRQVE